MQVNIKATMKETVAFVEGSINSANAAEFGKALAVLPGEAESVTLDIEGLDYISSAGLRVLLNMQKKFNAKNGKMVIRNANGMIMEVFEATGFLDIFTVEND